MQSKRIALVTGANRGIGREIARQLAGKGLRVLAAARTAAEAEKAARELGAGAVTLDVTRAEQISAVAEHLPEGLDVLVNNAGVSLDGFGSDVARATMDVNFFGAMHLTDRLLPRMRRGGRVVMVSSAMGRLSCIAPELRKRFESATLDRRELVELVEAFVRDVAEGVHSRRGWPSNAYSVSKVALNALTRVLARELEGDARGILVNSACPGWVRTRMGGSGAPRSVEQGARTPVWLALLPEGAPTGGFFQDEQPTPW